MLSIGVVITSLFSWALIPSHSCTTSLPACSHLAPGITPSASTCCTKQSNYGWRYALFTLGALSVLAFVARFGLFTFHESPKFLVSKGRDEEAVQVVKAVRAFNRRKSFGFGKWWTRPDESSSEEDDLLTLEDLQDCEREWEEREIERERLECECECEVQDDGDAIRRQAQNRLIDGLPTNSDGSGSHDAGRHLSGTPRPTSMHKKTSADDVIVESTSKHDIEDEAQSANSFGGVVRHRRRHGKAQTGGWKGRFGHLEVLFSTWGMARLTVLTWICYIADYWSVWAFWMVLAFC